MNGGILTAPMSETRLEVLRRIKQGLTMQQIGDRMFMTRQAALRQACICRKLGLVSGPGPNPISAPVWLVEPLGEALLVAVIHLNLGANADVAVKLLPAEAKAVLLLISKA